MKRVLTKAWIIAIALAFPALAWADTCTWNGSTGDWSTAANWSCGHKPSSADQVIINSGSVTLSENVQVSGFSMAGGTLSGSTNLTATSSFSWTGGSITGSGTVTAQSSATLSNVFLEGRTLQLAGGATWTGGHIRTSTDAKIVVPAGKTLTLAASSGTVVTREGTNVDQVRLQVLGTLLKNSATDNYVDVASSFEGPIAIQQGNLFLRYSATYTASADITVGSGALLIVQGGSHVMTGMDIAGLSASSVGTFRMDGGSVTLTEGATIQIPLILQGGTLTVTEAISVPRYTQTSGTLTGPGNVTVTTGPLSWTGGSMTGAGVVTAQQAATLANLFIEGRSLVLNGGGNWTSGHLRTSTDSRIVVPAGKTLSLTAGSGSVLTREGSNTDQTRLEVFGSLTKTAATDSYIDVMSAFDGPITVQLGSLFMRHGATYSETADIAVGSGALFIVQGGSHDMTGVQVKGLSPTSSGTFRVDGGAVNLLAGTTLEIPIVIQGGTVTVTEAISIPRFTQTSGTVTGPGDLTVTTGPFSWTGGSMTGAGRVKANQAATLANLFVEGRTLELAGGANWTNGHLRTSTDSKIVVPAGKTMTISAGSGSVITREGTNQEEPRFELLGSLQKTSSGDSYVDVVSRLEGPVLIQQGTLFMRSSATYSADADITIGSGALYVVQGGAHSMNGVQIAGVSPTSVGTFRIDNGTVAFSDGSTVDVPFVMQGGTVTINETMTFPRYTQTGGTLTGPGDFSVTGNFSWTGGSMTGSGKIVMNEPATLANLFLEGRTLELAAGGSWTGGHIRTSTDSKIVVPVGKTLTVSAGGGSVMTREGSNTEQVRFELLGTLVKTSASDNYIDVATISSGKIQVDLGTLLFRSSLRSTTTGIVAGSGSIDVRQATFTNEGLFSPGASPGILTFLGNYQNVRLDIELGGETPGTGYDRLNVNGPSALGGSLKVTLINSFKPSIGNEFVIMNFGSSTGAFANVELPSIGTDRRLLLAYTATEVKLVVTGPNAAPTASAITSPASGESIVIAGEPATPFVVTWEEATDLDGDQLSYSWQLALDDVFNTLIASVDAGTNTQLETTFGEIASLLTQAGIGLNETVTLSHRVVVTDGKDSTSGPPSTVTLTRGAIVSTEDPLPAEIPTEFALHGAYPNPFNPVTTIQFDVPVRQRVRVSVYDMLGREVQVLADGELAAGVHRATVDASGLASGVYVYRMTSGEFVQTKTMVLLK